VSEVDTDHARDEITLADLTRPAERAVADVFTAAESTCLAMAHAERAASHQVIR
jgi:hypothetical protein